jgi:hypothetical protein
MSLTRFQDYVFLEYKHHYFVWEASWEMFRPIDSIRWNGDRFELDDKQYCSDPMNEFYGYGALQMKRACTLLTEKYSGEMQNAAILETPTLGIPTWFRDRRVVLSPCAPTDLSSWKRMCRGHPRTCRKSPRGKKFTRRA